MDKTLFPIRLVFVALCAAAGWLVTIPITEWDRYRGIAFTVGLCIGLLVVLVDVMLKVSVPLVGGAPSAFAPEIVAVPRTVEPVAPS